MTKSSWPGILDGPQPLSIHYEQDNQGRHKKAWWSNGGSAYQLLVDGYTFEYSSTGASATETLDLSNNTLDITTFNNRLQPSQRKVTNPAVIWQLDYSYLQNCPANPNLNKNNGNVYGLDENTPGITTQDQTYCYDYLNRLISATNPGGWGLTYTMDRYANRPTQTGTGGASTVSVAISSTTNRITTGGYLYDAAGNMTAEPGFTYQYDAENRIKTVNNGATGTYVYDGDGRRAKRTANGETRWYFHDANGDPTWEYKQGVGWESFNLYFNGKHAAINNSQGLRWRHQDHLGSLRLKTDSAGAATCRYYYDPYGALLSTTCSESDARKFTDKERDPETALDYFGARYCDWALGRFTSIDPAWESFRPDNPQSANRYAYVLNNPLKFVDPDGQVPVLAVVAIAWAAFEIGASIYDGYTAVDTVLDPQASLGEKSVAVGGFALGVVGPGGGYGTFGKSLLRNSDELGRFIESTGKTIHNILNKELTGETIDAARRELAGEVVKLRPRDGKPYDHVQKVRQATEGLRGHVKNIQGLLQSGELTKKARAELESLLRAAKQKLAEVEKAEVF